MDKELIEHELKMLEPLIEEMLEPWGITFSEAMSLISRDEGRGILDMDYESLSKTWGRSFPGLVGIWACRKAIEIDPSLESNEVNKLASRMLCNAIRAASMAWVQFQANKLEHMYTEAARKELAKKAAFASHAKSREIAEEVMTWYRENRHRFPSMDRAAEAATKEFNRSFRTVRKHIGEEAKKLRSAGKA